MSMAARGVSSISSIASSPVVNLNKLLMNTNDLNGEVNLRRLNRLNNHYVFCGSEKKSYIIPQSVVESELADVWTKHESCWLNY